MDAGDGERAAPVERGQGGEDQRAYRGEQNGGVERLRRLRVGFANARRAEFSRASFCASAPRVSTCTRAPSAMAICAVRWADPPNP